MQVVILVHLTTVENIQHIYSDHLVNGITHRKSGIDLVTYFKLTKFCSLNP